MRTPLRAATLAAGAAMTVEASLYGVMPPLLPHYASVDHLATGQAGLVSAAYGVGAFIAALPGAAIATRYGSRRTMQAALVLMSLACVAVGLAQSAVTLEAFRFLQGIAGSTLWSAGLAWVAGLAPAETRGTHLGALTGTAIAGSVLGAPLGALAVAVGPEVVFSGLAAICLAMLTAVRMAPLDVKPRDRAGIAAIFTAPSRVTAAIGAWLIFMPAVGLGLVGVVGPLRLHALGSTSGEVAAVFLIGALAEALASRASGHLADRHGVASVTLPALMGAAITLVLIAPQHTAIGLGIVAIAYIAAAGAHWVPASLVLTASAARARLSDAQAFGIFNIAWAAGQATGASGGGGLAALTSDVVPCALLAATFTATLGALMLTGSRWYRVAT